MADTRVKQTRNKITWYSNIVLTMFGAAIIYIIKTEPELAVSLSPALQFIVGSMMGIVSFYHVSEGYTKGKFIDKSKSINNETE